MCVIVGIVVIYNYLPIYFRGEKMKREEILKVFRLEEIIDILTMYDVVHFDLDTSDIFGKFLFGFTDLYQKKIYVQKNISIKMARKTLIHELIHALKDKYGIKDKEKETESQSEFIYNMLYKNYIDSIRPYLLTGDENEKKD